jgi:predicted DCC family thiol-disulfide oxidoreductase YuxK
MYLLVDYDLPSEKLICNAAAILTVFRTLGGVWKLSAVAHILPLSWLDWIYSFVIRNRYRIFGRYDHCPIAPPHLRARFIDDDTSSPAARAS